MFMMAVCISCGLNEQYWCFHGNQFGSDDQDAQLLPTVKLSHITAFRLIDIAGGISADHATKQGLAFRSSFCLPHYLYCSLLFFLLSLNLKQPEWFPLKIIALAVASCQSLAQHKFLRQILNFLSESFPFQMTDSNLNRHKRTSSSDFSFKSVCLRGTLLTFFKKVNQVNE